MSALSSATLVPTLAASIAPASGGVATEQPEDQNLLELGEKIEPLLQAYRAASAREAEAFALFERIRPAVPEELRTAHEKYPFLKNCLVEESDGRGFVGPSTYVGPNGKTYAKQASRVLSSKELRIHIIQYDVDRNTKAGREARRLARLAMKYEQAFQDALSETNFPDLENETRWASYELEQLVHEIRKLEPKTVAGVLIFARALGAFQEAEECAGKIRGGSAQLLGPTLAAAVLRLGALETARAA